MRSWLVAVAMMAMLTAVQPSAAGSSSAATTRCSPAQTRALVARFISAFNAGDQRAINGVWASKLYFKWMSVTTPPAARSPEDAARRDTLLPYLAERHSVNERWALMALKINGVTARAYRNFEFRLTRAADDLASGSAAYEGKGASTCSSGRLIAWVMGAA
jgi:hypothetical protein